MERMGVHTNYLPIFLIWIVLAYNAIKIAPKTDAFQCLRPTGLAKSTSFHEHHHSNVISGINPRNPPKSALFMSTSPDKTIKDITKDAEERMKKSIDSVKQNLLTIRTGRASAQILDRVKVSYYGADTPLNQLASIGVPSAQQLTIEPYDKSIAGDIERAIAESDLGVMPTNDGTLIRINIPALTEDRRKELLKQCKAMGEEGKVAVRNIRRDGVDSVKKMEKNSDIGKDESKDGQDVIQKLTDKMVKEIDDIVATKEKEVMKV